MNLGGLSVLQFDFNRLNMRHVKVMWWAGSILIALYLMFIIGLLLAPTFYVAFQFYDIPLLLLISKIAKWSCIIGFVGVILYFTIVLFTILILSMFGILELFLKLLKFLLNLSRITKEKR